MCSGGPAVRLFCVCFCRGTSKASAMGQGCGGQSPALLGSLRHICRFKRETTRVTYRPHNVTSGPDRPRVEQNKRQSLRPVLSHKARGVCSWSRSQADGDYASSPAPNVHAIVSSGGRQAALMPRAHADRRTATARRPERSKSDGAQTARRRPLCPWC